MLGWDPESAILTLQHALEQNLMIPPCSAISAWRTRCVPTQNRDIDFAYAIEYLCSAIKARPKSPELIFNRAIVYERMYLYHVSL